MMRIGFLVLVAAALAGCDGGAGDGQMEESERGVVVDAPGVRVETGDNGTDVVAPGVNVDTGRDGTAVDAPGTEVEVER